MFPFVLSTRQPTLPTLPTLQQQPRHQQTTEKLPQTGTCLFMIRFILVQNRQGKTRLSKFYVPYDDDEKIRLRGEVHRLIAPRDQKYQSNFVEVSSFPAFAPFPPFPLVASLLC